MLILFSEVGGELRGTPEQWSCVVQYKTGVPNVFDSTPTGYEVTFYGTEPTKPTVVNALSVFSFSIGALEPLIDYLQAFESLWVDRLSKLKVLMSGTLQANGQSTDLAREFQVDHATEVEAYLQTGNKNLEAALDKTTSYPWLILIVPGTTSTVSTLGKKIICWDAP